MATNISNQTTTQIQKLGEISNNKPNSNFQQVLPGKQQSGSMVRTTSVTISESLKTNINKFSRAFAQIENDQQTVRKTAAEISLLQKLGKPIKHCDCGNSSQNITNLQKADQTKLASSIKSNNPIEFVPKNANKIDQITIDSDSTKFTEPATINMQNFGKFDTQSVKVKSLINQSLNTTKIDLPINLVEIKNQILSEARNSLVDETSLQFSVMQALIKP